MASLQEHDISLLANYVPEAAAQDVINFMHSYKIHLKIKRERKRILGDYRPAYDGKPHTISINANLNKYHFLITFLHELAHLINYLNHQQRVKSHGVEWKQVFTILLKNFTDKKIFPVDIEMALKKSMQNIAASTCSDPHLFKVLYQYDARKENVFLVEQLAIGDYFKTEKNQQYRLIEKRRTRYVCEEVKTKKKYLFPSIYEVYKL